MEISSYGEIYDVRVEKKYYENNHNLALRLIDKSDGSVFAVLTKNLDRRLPLDQAYVDTNNCPWAVDFIAKNKLGVPMKEYRRSGYCAYPLYRFFLR